MKEEKSGPSGASRKPVAKITPEPAPAPVAPLFRRIDWITFGLTTLLVLIGYLLTISPQVTLEDSGELAVASQWAGVPHPPGYPVWTLYTWVFTKIIPFGNMAFRVALSSAVAGAFACGLIALLVSRGSSMMLESIQALKDIDKQKESVVCMVCGFVAGMLMGFNGFMWSQSIIVEVYTLSVLSLMMTLCCLLRWLYAPEHRRYLYIAMFLFGVCLTNHMSLLVVAVGILVLVGAANPTAGRELFTGSAVAYAAALVAAANDSLTKITDSPTLFGVFNFIGIITVIGTIYFTVKTGKAFSFVIYGCLAVIGFLASKSVFLAVVGLIGLVVLVVMCWRQSREWVQIALLSLMAWFAGVAWYGYMPVSSMTNPPLNWGYPRTSEGFFHALSRGQYDSIKPTNVFAEPVKFVKQIGLYVDGAREEFSLVLLLVGLVPFVFINRMQARERAWLIGLSAIFLCLSLMLLILLNPALDRQSRELHKVFFTASHVIVAMGIGYGFALASGWLMRHYEEARRWALIGGGVAVFVALYRVVDTLVNEFAVMEGHTGLWSGLTATLRHGLNFFPVVSGLVLLGLCLGFVALLAVGRQRVLFGPLMAVLLLIPSQSILSHWADNEQRGHMFGFWFGHDMFTPPFEDAEKKPLYPEMTRDAVLFGGTDPGRFNPTYMIFSESFTPPKHRTNPEFDRRDVVLITQNALADGTYLNYIRAQYNRSAQIDPPFFSEFGLTRWLGPVANVLDNVFTNLGNRIERERRLGTSDFQPEHFKELASFQSKLAGTAANRPVALGDHLRSKLSPETAQLLSGPADTKLARALAADLTRVINGEDLWDAERFAGVELSPRLQFFVKRSPAPYERVRRNRLLLEEAYPEIEKSLGGLYPDMEILTPTRAESERSFNEYITDAQRRYQLGQLRPGEDFRIDERSGRVSVSGQVAVMAINGLLTKVIFDQNPEHEFFVEESFPLEWMYPHLSPYGIIMKINREPLAEITQEMADRDHQFWRQYANRLSGDWITYDTPVEEICKFVERVYLLNDYRGYVGDRRFARDDNAQKAFSKLRSSIGGIYAWRLGLASGSPTPPQHMPKSDEERQRMLKEADFAFKQAFAFCPYSPEAVYRYVNLLMATSRMDDAIRIAETCLKFDEQNDSIRGLVESLRTYRNPATATSASLLETTMKALGDALRLGQTNEALDLIDQVIQSPRSDAALLMQIASLSMQMGQMPRVENALVRLTQVQPDNPEAHYDLAVLRSLNGRPEAIASLSIAVRLSNQRLKNQPGAPDLAKTAANEPRFQPYHQMPEFQRALLGQ